MASERTCPPTPVISGLPQRAKVLVMLEPGSDPPQMWVDCWARIDGAWLMFLDDEESRWVSWPMQHIRCVEWQQPVAADDA